MFRLDTEKANALAVVSGKSGDEITDKLLTDELPETVIALHDGTISYEYALSYLAEMHRRGLISGSDFHVEVPTILPASPTSR
jgi:hypothetical protein